MKRTCRDCGKGELVGGRERVHYTDSGLPNVWLDNVEVRRCPVCKEHVVIILAVEHLHRAIELAAIASDGHESARINLRMSGRKWQVLA